MRPRLKRLRLFEDSAAAPAERANGNHGAAKRTPPRDATPSELTRRNGTRPAGTAKSDRTSADARADASITRAAFHVQSMTLATLGLLAAAAALSAHVMTDGGQPLRARTVRAGELTVQAPVGWQRTRLPDVRLGSLSESLAAAPPGRVDIALTAGVIREPAATRRELRQVPPRGTEPAIVRLGRLEVSRYSGLGPRPGTTGTAYVVHTTGPSILIMCEAPAVGGRGALRACGRAADTARLRGERPVPVTVAQGRRSAVRAALADLAAERLVARDRIAAAELADEQAAETRALQLSYEQAWGRVLEIDMPGRETADLLAVLGDAAAAYGAMATAISSGDQPGYDDARAGVYEAEAALWSETGPSGVDRRVRQSRASTATGIRTPVSAVRGRRPSPLDDGGE